MNKTKKIKITSFGLHLIAIITMLIDHIAFVLMPDKIWMRAIGRLAFPIFAFMIVEGYFHTKDIKKYMTRLIIFAILSEIPFNLITSLNIFNPYAQNVIWTFVISLSAIIFIEKIKLKYQNNKFISYIFIAIIVIIAFFLGMITLSDYLGYGVLMVLTFYFFRENTEKSFSLKLIALIFINVILLSPYSITLININNIKIPLQILALFSLPIIQLYNGKKGYSNTFTKYFFYSFYPLHLLILAVIAIIQFGLVVPI